MDYAKQKQDESGVKLLWGTANLFSNTRFVNGAATNLHLCRSLPTRTRSLKMWSTQRSNLAVEIPFSKPPRGLYVAPQHTHEAPTRPRGDFSWYGGVVRRQTGVLRIVYKLGAVGSAGKFLSQRHRVANFFLMFAFCVFLYVRNRGAQAYTILQGIIRGGRDEL